MVLIAKGLTRQAKEIKDTIKREEERSDQETQRRRISTSALQNATKGLNEPAMGGLPNKRIRAFDQPKKRVLGVTCFCRSGGGSTARSHCDKTFSEGAL